jgi:hypothetical protein
MPKPGEGDGRSDQGTVQKRQVGLAFLWPVTGNAKNRGGVAGERATTAFTCRAGGKESGISKKRHAGPVQCNARFAVNRYVGVSTRSQFSGSRKLTNQFRVW